MFFLLFASSLFFFNLQLSTVFHLLKNWMEIAHENWLYKFIESDIISYLFQSIRKYVNFIVVVFLAHFVLNIFIIYTLVIDDNINMSFIKVTSYCIFFFFLFLYGMLWLLWISSRVISLFVHPYMLIIMMFLFITISIIFCVKQNFLRNQNKNKAYARNTVWLLSKIYRWLLWKAHAHLL